MHHMSQTQVAKDERMIMKPFVQAVERLIDKTHWEPSSLKGRRSNGN